MTEIDDTFILKLTAIVGAAGIKRKSELDHLDPGCNPDNLAAPIAVAPRSAQAISEILALSHRHGIGVVPHGGRTGLAGGAVPGGGELVLLTTALDAQIEIDADAAIAVVDAGVVLATLETAANKHGLTVGIDIGARGSATIGGMISTNAGGGEAFRNGIMRQRVLGLEAVLADGTVVSDLKRVAKANEGLDVKQLFIGAEGTLGVVTRAVLKLQPADGNRTTLLVGCASAAAAVSLFTRLRCARRISLMAAEIMWRDYAHTAASDLKLDAVVSFADCAVYVIFDVGVPDDADQSLEALTALLANALDSGGISDAVIAKNQVEQRNIWQIREDSWAIDRQHPHGLWYDVSVPQAHLDGYVASVMRGLESVDPNFRLFVMGHLGDGNLHLTISRGTPSASDYDRVAAVVYRGLAEMGGSFSAEHGIGTEKRIRCRSSSTPASSP